VGFSKFQILPKSGGELRLFSDFQALRYQNSATLSVLIRFGKFQSLVKRERSSLGALGPLNSF
jgi:hypothetical protein